MLAKHPEPSFKDATHSQEEHRLLNELTHIDQKLRNRINTQNHNQEWRAWDNQEQKADFYRNKWNGDRENNVPPICTQNMEYFSEICNEDIDDDSLFDPRNNFLEAPNPVPQHDSAKSNELATICPKKKDMSAHNSNQISLKSSQSQASLSSQSQISKEHNYVYKKQTQNRSQSALKLPPPPKNSKAIANKLAINPSKGELKSQVSNNKDRALKQVQMKKNPSKQKYIVKPVIYQQQESQQTEQIEFKFHTFEAYLQKNHNNQQQEKNIKSSKCKHQQINKDSLQCTFKPTILKKSSEMVKSKKCVVQRLSSSTQQPKEQKKPYQRQNKQTLNRSRLDELSQPRKLKTQGQDIAQETFCFKPNISKKSLEQMSNCTYDVATRNQLWLEQREQKIEKLRQQQERERRKREDCTYSPSLCQYKGDNGPSFSRFGREGMVNYFERLSAVSKGDSKPKLKEVNKQNRQSCINISKQGFTSKGGKKQRYEEAVKQLHNRILCLKI